MLAIPVTSRAPVDSPEPRFQGKVSSKDYHGRCCTLSLVYYHMKILTWSLIDPIAVSICKRLVSCQ